VTTERLLAAGAAAIALATTALYAAFVEGDADRTALVALTLASAGASAAVATVSAPGVRLVLLTWAGATLLLWGVLALFSIGLILIVAGGLAAAAASAAAPQAPAGSLRLALAAAVAAAATIVVGIGLTG
jgi:hypothetical protein